MNLYIINENKVNIILLQINFLYYFFPEVNCRIYEELIFKPASVL